jgi:hypothetical protein
MLKILSPKNIEVVFKWRLYLNPFLEVKRGDIVDSGDVFVKEKHVVGLFMYPF